MHILFTLTTMADDIPIKKRSKKANFTAEEEHVIQKEVEKFYKLITEKVSNTLTHKKKQEVWQNIAEKTSALGTLRTAKEVKDKWFNTKKAAKKAYTERKRSINKTGGGPPSKPLSAAVERVLNMCQDSASFKGIDGVETDGRLLTKSTQVSH